MLLKINLLENLVKYQLEIMSSSNKFYKNLLKL